MLIKKIFKKGIYMFKQKRIPIYDFVYAISEIVDPVSPTLNNHHKSVAYMSCRIAREMNTQEVLRLMIEFKKHM